MGSNKQSNQIVLLSLDTTWWRLWKKWGKSKLLSIGKWYQRRTLFICGYTKEDFLNYDFKEDSDASNIYNEQIDVEVEDADADNMRDFFSIDDDIMEDERTFHSYIRDRTINTEYV